MFFKEFSKNTQGTDYFVGDIHGQYSKLMNQLKELNFDFQKDRLFSVGDIIDRGPESFECLSLMFEPWFFMVKGNHEILMIDAIQSDYFGGKRLWEFNGGKWNRSLTGNQKILLSTYVKELETKIPFVIKIGKILVVHQGIPLGFERINDLLENQDRSYLKERLVWDRASYGFGSGHFKDSELIVSGHNITESKELEFYDNQLFLDVGSVYYDLPLCIISEEEVLSHKKI